MENSQGAWEASVILSTINKIKFIGTKVAVVGKWHFKEKETLWNVKSLFLGYSSPW